jgi:hypothetical protein
MNNLSELEKCEVNENALQFGLSTLHGWIRCLELVLHVSYRLPFKQYQVSKKSDNYQIMQRNRREIQECLRSSIGVLVDLPTARGGGTTNTGNTARRLFGTPKEFSDVTHFDLELIERFDTILRVVNSGYEIDEVKFAEFCSATEKRFIDTYPWYYLPSSVHKLLHHGPQVIASFPLPIGAFTEEALESQTKTVRFLRAHHTRTKGRKESNEDLFSALCVATDPLIVLFRNLRSVKKSSTLPSAVRELLVAPNIELPESSAIVSEMEHSYEELEIEEEMEEGEDDDLIFNSPPDATG